MRPQPTPLRISLCCFSHSFIARSEPTLHRSPALVVRRLCACPVRYGRSASRLRSAHPKNCDCELGKGCEGSQRSAAAAPVTAQCEAIAPRQSRPVSSRFGLSQNMYGSFGVDLPRLINCAVTDLRANYNALVCVKSKPIRSFKYVAFEL
jgi:hypothetical protein